ncbi:MAG: NapC/NirT family cytochrome c [Magnetococcales bacterium]|nr:NapC/NirT family cytochrome c [Magnetococcales bacterium]
MEFLKRLWAVLRQPSESFALGTLLLGGFVAGGVFFLVFHFGMHATSHMELCISCHEMEGVYAEYKETTHYSNRTGVRAECADCHVPHGATFGDWLSKIWAKAYIGSKDIWHHTIGTYSEKGSFDKARYELAQSVIHNMKSRDSKECRGCHNFDAMNFEKQDRTAAKKHRRALEQGGTCIDCHVGVAHKEQEEPEGKGVEKKAEK